MYIRTKKNNDPREIQFTIYNYTEYSFVVLLIIKSSFIISTHGFISSTENVNVFSFTH